MQEKEDIVSHFKNCSRKEADSILDWLQAKGIDSQKIDFMAMDQESDFNTLKESLQEEYGLSFCTRQDIELDNKRELLKAKNSFKDEDSILDIKSLKQVRTIAIFGEPGTGKTALAYSLLNVLKPFKEVYFLKHPNPQILKEMGFKQLISLEEMERMRNIVLYIDEPQIHIPIYDRKSNAVIAKICSLARQLDITLIISSSDTRVFTKHNESYFDLWLIKDLDFTMVKNGSKIKKAVKNHSIFDPEGFRLEVDEFLSESRKLIYLNGKHTFNLPSGFDERHSKPYNLEIPEKTAKGMTKENLLKNNEKGEI